MTKEKLLDKIVNDIVAIYTKLGKEKSYLIYLNDRGKKELRERIEHALSVFTSSKIKDVSINYEFYKTFGCGNTGIRLNFIVYFKTIHCVAKTSAHMYLTEYDINQILDMQSESINWISFNELNNIVCNEISFGRILK